MALIWHGCFLFWYSGSSAGSFAARNPSVAVSLATSSHEADYSFAACVGLSVAEHLATKPALSRSLININIPDLPQEAIKA